MKKLSLAIIVALAASLAIAQGPGGRPGGPGGPGGQRGGFRMDPKQYVEMLDKQLKLSPTQKKEIIAMQTSRTAEMDKLRNAPGDRTSKRPQMEKLRGTYTAKMKKILNKEQQAKFEKMMAEMRARFGGGRPGGPGGGRPGAGGPPSKGGA